MTRFPHAIHAIVACFALAAALLFTGCQPEKEPTTHLVVTATPKDAVATANGSASQAKLPLDIHVDTYGHMLEITAPGHRPAWLEVPADRDDVTLHVDLEPITAPVRIVTIPVGAIAKLDGEDIGVTPITVFDVGWGEHELVLDAAGYASRTVTITIDDAEPQELRFDLSSIMGSIQVASVPGNAQVFIDGGVRGRTSPTAGEYTTIDGVLEGEHEIVLKLEHHDDITAKFFLERNGALKLETYAFKQKPGGVTLRSEPTGALIFLDGENMGNTPKTISDLQPGEYAFRLERTGYAPETVNVVISPGLTKTAEGTLTKTTGSILLTTAPPGCVVLIDNQRVGTTKIGDNDTVSENFEFDGLQPGRHIVEIQHPKYEPKRMAIVVTRGETVNLGKVELDALFIPTHRLVIRNPHTNQQSEYEGILVKDERPEGELVFRTKYAETSYKAEEVVSIRKQRP